jgi:GTP cyclohydrolase FolE2
VQLQGRHEPGELVRIAEEEASCEVFGLLKRPDEKWVTERAYDNPKFVEDLVRDIALRLRGRPRIAELVGGIGKLRVDPQPFGLRADRGTQCLTC